MSTTDHARNRGLSAVLDFPVVVADSPVDRAFVAFSLETGGTAIILTRSIPRPNPMARLAAALSTDEGSEEA